MYHTVGDRVEVQWDEQKFAASVVYVHPGGECDVVYDFDSSIGKFVTPEKHGLALLPDREQGRRRPDLGEAREEGHEERRMNWPGPSTLSPRPPRLDSGDDSPVGRVSPHASAAVDGPPTMSPRGGTDNEATRRKRRAKRNKPCSAKGCTTNAHARGLCVKHGANGHCSVQGCSTNAHTRGLCRKHGAGGSCSVQGCSSNVRARGLCSKHGANGNCSVKGCRTASRQGGLCTKHGPNVTSAKKKPAARGTSERSVPAATRRKKFSEKATTSGAATSSAASAPAPAAMPYVTAAPAAMPLPPHLTVHYGSGMQHVAGSSGHEMMAMTTDNFSAPPQRWVSTAVTHNQNQIFFLD